MRTGKETDQARPTHSLKTAEGGTYQDTETIRPTEAHSLSGDGRQSDLSGHRNNPTGRGPLTFWRRQTEQLVRTPKQSDRPRPTHQLEMADRATCQDTETIRPTEAHSLPGDGRQSDLSGHRNNPTDRGPLTDWRRQTERLVRTPKQSDRPRPTHILETADRATCQDTERIRPIEAHSHPGDGRQSDLSGQRNNPTDRGPLTDWRRQTKRLVRTPKQSDQSRPTHILETADKATCQDTERIRPTEAHSQAGDSRQSDLSGHRKNQTDRGTLTGWRQQTERLVRTPKQSDRPRPTHILETADRAICQDTETIRPTEAHSPTGDSRQSDLSGHRNNPTNQGPLTYWRRQTERLVRTPKESDQPRPTHQLETADRATCQDTETIRPTEAHSPPGDGIQSDLSGHPNNPTD